MIALRVTVPFASWRKGHAREFFETETIPPPSTCYGMLLALVGEEDRERHRGCRVTAGVVRSEGVSTVLRTVWRIKELGTPQGNGENARPDFQQIVVNSDLVVLCDSSEEQGVEPRLERRVVSALRHPDQIARFGGLSLGESTHLINDLWLLEDGALPGDVQIFLHVDDGPVTLPVWVDHVGSAGTRYAVGDMVASRHLPTPERLPRIPTAEPSAPPSKRRRRG